MQRLKQLRKSILDSSPLSRSYKVFSGYNVPLYDMLTFFVQLVIDQTRVRLLVENLVSFSRAYLLAATYVRMKLKAAEEVSTRGLGSRRKLTLS
jgi:hypothetical protein